MRHSSLLAVAVAAVAITAALFAGSAGAYGGGAGHDVWQVGLSVNCNNPSSIYCLDENGDVSLGGFWGWAEFDRWSDGSITGDAQFAGCGHTVGGGGPGFAGAGHADVDITRAHIGPAQPDDPNYPDGSVFYVDSNVVNGVADDPEFLGDSGIPAEAGHYSFHPERGVAFMIQVAYRPAR